MLTKQLIEKYFIAEKNESLIFLIIGIIAIVLAFVCYQFLKTNFYKGAAIPLLVLGLLQAIAGYTVYTRSDKQRIDNVYAYDMNPDKIKNEELPRMKTVNRNFLIYRWIEILFLAAGLLLIFLYRTHVDKTFWYGLGIALAIEAALLLAADYVAADRARRYTEQIEIFVNKNKTT